MDKKNVEAIYPLSPMQAGMLFHSLLEPASGVYVEQYCCTLLGEVDGSAMRSAWQAAIERHATLRTLFNWQVREEPLQIVLHDVTVPMEELDWRSAPPQIQVSQLEELLAADRSRGFDLAKAPLMRLALIRIQDLRTVLVWTFHHAVLDGWSVSLLLDEVSARYTAQICGQSIAFEPPHPYRDYISWLAQQDSAAAEQYWRKQLAGLDAGASFPLLQAEALNPHAKMGRLERYLDKADSAALQDFARRYHLTLGTIVQGAWALLLAHYTNECDVVFGVTVANRPAELPDVEQMVGLFINTLPARIAVPPQQPLHTWLGTLQAAQGEARRYGHVSLVQLQQWSSLQNGNRLFDSLVLFENQPTSGARFLEAAGLQLADEQVYERTSFPLTLVSGPGESLPLILYYNSSRLPEPAAQQIALHLATLLVRFAAAPEAPLASLSMLSGDECERIVNTAQTKSCSYPPPHTIHGLFLQQVQRTPQQTALLEGDSATSYLQLACRSAGIAAALSAAGAHPGSIVAVCAERSSTMVAGLLGILMAGAAYLPLDPTYPSARLAYMLEDSGAGILLAERKLAERLDTYNGCILWLDETAPTPEPPCLEQMPSLPVDAAAYVIYTSGSTGRPKGVIGTHRGAANRMYWMWEQYPFASGERCVQKTTLSFVDSVCEIFGPLLQGVPAVLLPQTAVQDARALVDSLHAGCVTRIVLVPSLLRALLDLYPDLHRRLPLLRLWVCSGETLPADLVQRFRRQMPHARLLNLYGSSEVSADVTCFDTTELAPEARTVPIGRPLPNCEVYVLDCLGAPAPAGVAGEVYVGGVHLANGYLHQPQLTEERFLTLPIPSRGAVRLYRTGDRAYYLPDGNLVYLGRRDDQLKVRGMRIELAEVRAALAQHPSIEQVEVVVQHTHDEVSLVAYIVTRSRAAFDGAHLRRFAAEQLPSHMLPAHFVQLASLPLTPNGKVDRLRLPKRSLALEAGPPNAVAPRNDVETRLAAIWHTLLRQEPIDVHTDFFAAGGHSLLAMHLFVRIEREFGVTLPLASLVQEATIAHLAQLIRAQTEPSRWQSLVSIQPFGSHPPLFCVHGITGDVLWFRDLGRLLAPDQPLFGLQAPALDGMQAPLDSVYTMAQSYVAEIRSQQPSGPYYLGGASFGGTVALEMAQQLLAAGEEVALLIQFDHAPLIDDQRRGGRAMLGKTARLVRNVPYWLGSMREMDAERVKARVRRKASNAWGRLSQMAHLSPERSIQTSNLIDYADQLPPNRRLVIESHFRAISTYQPQPYAGNVLLLRAEAQPLLSTIDSAARWSSLTGNRVQVHTVPGSHEGMFQEPHVQQLADAVRQALRQYQKGSVV